MAALLEPGVGVDIQVAELEVARLAARDEGELHRLPAARLYG